MSVVKILICVSLMFCVLGRGAYGADAPGDGCLCLINGGRPGPGDCPCDVLQCYEDCVSKLCPSVPNCTLECSFQCVCVNDVLGCPGHVDPGPTSTPVEPTPTLCGITPCEGDCNADCSVVIDELILGVRILLGFSPLSSCESVDSTMDGVVTVDELVRAVSRASVGCE